MCVEGRLQEERLVPSFRALPLSPEFTLSRASSGRTMLSTGWWKTEMAAVTTVRGL